MNLATQGFDLKYYLKVFFRWKWYFIIPFFGLIIIVNLISFFSPEKYVASSIILAEKGKIINPLIMGVGVSMDEAERLRNLEQKILNKPQLEKIARELELGENLDNPFEMETTLRSLKNMVTLETKGTDYFEISCKGTNPDFITRIVQKLVDGFLKKSVIESEKDSYAAVNFMKSQLEVYKKKLEQSEKALKEFKQKYIDEMPGTENVVLITLNNYKSQLAETKLSLKEIEMEMSSLQKQLDKEQEIVLKEKTVERDPIFQTLRNLKKDLAEQTSRYTENHPEVIGLKKQIDDLEKQIKAEEINDLPIIGSETSSFNPTYRALYERLNSAKINYQTLKTREAHLKKNMEIYETKVQNIPAREEELTRLTRDYAQNDEMYRTFLRKLEEARVSGKLAEENKGEKFRVVDPVKKPIKPFSPNRLNILLLSIIFSSALGLAMVFVKEFLDDTLKDYHEAEEFLEKGMVLGTISKITSQENLLKQDYRDKLTLVACLLLFFVIVILGYIGSLDLKF